MKKDGKYRFSLQFPGETEAQIKVGELLEQIGNKKSAIIVEAVSDYIDAHPELLSAKGNVTIRLEHEHSHGQIEALIYKILKEKFEDISPLNAGSAVSSATNSIDEISLMLDNLDYFQ